MLLWQLQEERRQNPLILCEYRMGNAESPRQKLQTFKTAVHLWYSPRVSSEASYPQNG